MKQIQSTSIGNLLSRRQALAQVGLGILAASYFRQADAAEAGSGTADVGIVNAFCAAWASGNLGDAMSHLAPQCVYRMTEKTPPITGVPAIQAVFEHTLNPNGHAEFNVLETHSLGPIVINHRIDRFTSISRPFQWEGVGVFFVQDARIVEWQDFTIKLTR